MDAQKRAREASSDLFLVTSDIPGYEPADMEFHWVSETNTVGFTKTLTVAVET